jgi:1-acyl-sn-glycerol-3-phosphate acyltransferase
MSEEIDLPAVKSLHPISVWARIIGAFMIIGPFSIVYVLVCALLLPWRALRIKSGNLYGKTVGRFVPWVMGMETEVMNKERLDAERPAIYICNHTSTLDMWIGMWRAPMGVCGIAKKEITKIPFFGQAYLLSGHLLVDRSNRERAIEAMEKVAETVRRHNLSMWMWPEGTRSLDGRLKPMKKGFVHLAIATKLPIVPVVFHDFHRRWVPRSFKVFPGQLRVEVLEVIDTSNWTAESIDEHLVQVRNAFLGALSPGQLPLNEGI